jgi:hypothetical protein
MNWSHDSEGREPVWKCEALSSNPSTTKTIIKIIIIIK